MLLSNTVAPNSKVKTLSSPLADPTTSPSVAKVRGWRENAARSRTRAGDASAWRRRGVSGLRDEDEDEEAGREASEAGPMMA